jgi:hypothetical protein
VPSSTPDSVVCSSVGAARSTSDFGFRICPELGQTEIQDLHASVFRDEQVFRLEVAVDDALAVRGGQSVRHLQGLLGGFAWTQRPVRQPLAQGLAFEQFTHEIRCAPVNPGFVNRQHVGMIQRRQRLGLLLEAPQPVGLRREVLRQHLYCYVAVEAGVARAKHFSHPTRAKALDDLEVIERGADHLSAVSITRRHRSGTPSHAAE